MFNFLNPRKSGILLSIIQALMPSYGPSKTMAKRLPPQKSQRSADQVEQLKIDAQAKRDRKNHKRRQDDLACQFFNRAKLPHEGRPSQKFCRYKKDADGFMVAIEYPVRGNQRIAV